MFLPTSFIVLIYCILPILLSYLFPSLHTKARPVTSLCFNPLFLFATSFDCFDQSVLHIPLLRTRHSHIPIHPWRVARLTSGLVSIVERCWSAKVNNTRRVWVWRLCEAIIRQSSLSRNQLSTNYSRNKVRTTCQWQQKYGVRTNCQYRTKQTIMVTNDQIQHWQRNSGINSHG